MELVEGSSCSECSDRIKLQKCSNKYPCSRIGCSNKYKCKKEYLMCESYDCSFVSHDENEILKFKKYQSQLIQNQADYVIDLLSLKLDEGKELIRTKFEALSIVENDSPDQAQEEKKLMKDLFGSEHHPDFPFIIAVEWFYDINYESKGKGDVVFSNFYFPSSEWKKLLHDSEYYSDKCSALKILVVEVKYENKNNKGYVGTQLNNSMQAWRDKRKYDEIWGGIYTQKYQDNWWKYIELFDDIKIKKLILEPAHSHLWSRPSKSTFPVDLWNNLLQFYKVKSSNKCEICQSNNDRLVLHQKWTVGRSVTFLGFELLCLLCHDVKHPGRAGLSGRDIVPQLVKVNGWDIRDSERQIMMSFADWEFYNKLKIGKVNIEILESHEIVKNWREKNPNYKSFPLRSFCCKFDHRQ